MAKRETVASLKELGKKGLSALSVLQSRRGLAASLGKSFSGDRDLYPELGYPKILQFDQMAAKYERQDIAGRIVDLPPQDTWKNGTEVKEADTKNAGSKFELEWEALVKRLRIWHFLERVDRLAGIGEYGVLMLGLKGQGENELMNEAEAVNGPDGLIFLSTFDQESADVLEFDTDPASPRFGLPEVYQIEVGERSKEVQRVHTINVHWSRIIHVAEDLLEDEVNGRPRLRRIYNRLDDLEKVVGGGSEAIWRLIYQGLVLSTKEGFEKDEGTVNDDEISEFIHGFRRVLELEGLEANFVGGEVVDPSGMFGVLLSLISGDTGIPQRLLIGSERGELASTTDQQTWAAVISSRQTTYAEPTILRSFIDRLIVLKVLTPPASEEGYQVNWPSPFELDLQQKSEIAERIAKALAAVAPPGAVDFIIDPAEFIRIFIPELEAGIRDVIGEVREEEEEDEETPASIEQLAAISERARALVEQS